MNDYQENQENIDDLIDVELQKLIEEVEKLTFNSLNSETESEDEKTLNKSLSELDDFMEQEFLKIELPLQKLHPDAIVPSYAYILDSGFDLYSTEEIELLPFGRALVPTGLAFEVPDGTELQIRSKSGLAINQGLMVLNSPGTVDCGYLGEIKVIIMNMNNHSVTIEKGTKVGQGVLCPVYNGKRVKLIEKESLGTSDRGNKGFGSTGLK
jgi:dUTP pyrophosphatase